ncbi:MAG TPA: SRPBCC family protein [Actinomycetota bacterium]|nr:SRPBCC family protein [Actinomycetota bacterium]
MEHRVDRTIETACAAAAAFAFVADFSTTARWDPGIIAARRLDDGPIGMGSRFELVSRFGSREQTIVYEITGFEPPTRVTLEGDGETFRGTDVISCEPRDEGGTRVRYEADLGLKGVAALALPFIRKRLDAMSDDAVAGLRSALDALA